MKKEKNINLSSVRAIWKVWKGGMKKKFHETPLIVEASSTGPIPRNAARRATTNRRMKDTI